MKRLQHLAIIAHDMGTIFLFLGGITLLPLLIAILFQEWDVLLPMALVPAIFSILGALSGRIKKTTEVPRLSVTIIAVALTWIAISLVGAIPFYLIAHMNPTDCIFETMSAWTGTGFSVMTNLDTTSNSLLFWRTFMQWIGGIGVISFGIAMISRSGLALSRLYRSEGRPEALMPSIVSTGRRIWGIYLVLTVIFIILAALTGISLWDAINVVMVSISTGGFSIHDAGISYYNNASLEALLIPVMIIGALPFKLYFIMYRGRISAIWKDRTVRVILLLATAGSLWVTVNLWLFSDFPITTAVRQGVFCTVSGFTCCGLQNSNLDWLPLPLMIIMMLMVIGGAAGSTAGGIKVDRFILAYEGLGWWFRRFFVRGTVMVPFSHAGKSYPGDFSAVELSKNMLVIMLYVLMIGFAVIFGLHLAATSSQLHVMVFDMVSAASNVGLGAGYFTPASPVSIKWLFIFLMWAGRLEIIPVLILAVGVLQGFEIIPSAKKRIHRI
jgi:trk system potassium uptake protein TrkH